jgi:hypothetical protein
LSSSFSATRNVGRSQGFSRFAKNLKNLKRSSVRVSYRCIVNSQ